MCFKYSKDILFQCLVIREKRVKTTFTKQKVISKMKSKVYSFQKCGRDHKKGSKKEQSMQQKNKYKEFSGRKTKIKLKQKPNPGCLTK